MGAFLSQEHPAWNMGSVQYIFWVGSACLIQFINNIVWKDNAINWAPVWCDISGCLNHARRASTSPFSTQRLDGRWRPAFPSVLVPLSSCVVSTTSQISLLSMFPAKTDVA